MNMQKFGVLATFGCLLSLPAAEAQTATSGSSALTQASISVKGSDLIIGANQYTGAPDEFGGFEIAIKLPQKGIVAKNCAEDGISGSLSVMMSDVTPVDPSNPSEKDKKLIQEQVEYYNQLMTLSKTKNIITITVTGNSAYLKRRGAELVFPYCSTEFSKSGN